MIDYGWISLDRKILNHWLMDNSKYFHAWVLILFHVNFEEKKVMIKGKLYTCKRGQSLYSLENWARIFGRDWTRRQVRTFFDTLESRSMVSRESDNKTSYLTVCNYDTYQGSRSSRSPAEVQHSSTTKQRKKEKNTNVEFMTNLIGYLNQETGKDFKSTTKQTISAVNARLVEGFTKMDFKTVIDTKVKQWLNDPEMEQFLRPQTLFGTKFESYLNSNGQMKQKAYSE